MATPLPVRRRGTDRAPLVFRSATAVGLLHAFDDAVLHRQPGVPLGQHLPALVAVTAVAVVAVVVFPRLRTGLRAATALLFGGVILTNGAMHAIHVVLNELSGSDLTGLLATGAGAVLVAMSALLPFLHRGERTTSAPHRWAVRGVATAGTVAMVLLVVMPIGVAIGQTHLFRVPIEAPPSDAYEVVTFRSTDGLQLAGWYAPSRNGAAVVVVNSSGGDRLGSVDHAALLARHGYGVLLYDARGAGLSQGSPNGYGWGWDADVAGAVTYLRGRQDVDGDRIGGLGLSTGADVLIEVAAEDPALRSVVADGATIRSLADIPSSEPLNKVIMAPALSAVALFSGTRPGAPLEELAARVSPTPLLLIAAGSIPQEIAVNSVYAQAAGEPVDLWTLPQARHTRAIHDQAAAYEQRVVAHFDRSLLSQ